MSHVCVLCYKLHACVRVRLPLSQILFCSIELTLFQCAYCREMSEYQNVVGGKLKLKGKALDVKEGGVKKKKKKKQHREESSQIGHEEVHEGFSH